ncbi:MAG: hypothetical protein BWX64_02839 [Acidobacteria bacterium ADurb.Bin051]|nr:MAG: hypothetical protein BWX64_02839 [Acidobacteria bacterium ADurb.Bin051]
MVDRQQAADPGPAGEVGHLRGGGVAAPLRRPVAGLVVGEPDLVEEQPDAAHERLGLRVEDGVGDVGERVADPYPDRAARVALRAQTECERTGRELRAGEGNDLDREREIGERDREEGRREEPAEGLLRGGRDERGRGGEEAYRTPAPDAGKVGEADHVVEVVMRQEDVEPRAAGKERGHRRFGEPGDAAAGVEQQRVLPGDEKEAHRLPAVSREVAAGAEGDESQGHREPRCRRCRVRFGPFP